MSCRALTCPAPAWPSLRHRRHLPTGPRLRDLGPWVKGVPVVGPSRQQLCPDIRSNGGMSRDRTGDRRGARSGGRSGPVQPRPAVLSGRDPAAGADRAGRAAGRRAARERGGARRPSRCVAAHHAQGHRLPGGARHAGAPPGCRHPDRAPQGPPPGGVDQPLRRPQQDRSSAADGGPLAGGGPGHGCGRRGAGRARGHGRDVDRADPVCGRRAVGDHAQRRAAGRPPAARRGSRAARALRAAARRGVRAPGREPGGGGEVGDGRGGPVAGRVARRADADDVPDSVGRGRPRRSSTARTSTARAATPSS